MAFEVSAAAVEDNERMTTNRRRLSLSWGTFEALRHWSNKRAWKWQAAVDEAAIVVVAVVD